MKRKSVSLSYRSSPLPSLRSRGRRFEKRVLNAAGKRILRERYVYVGYTCVQVLNGDNGNAVEKEFVWDPTEPASTRPLTWFFAKRGLNLFYAHDGNKNVSDVFFLSVQNGVAAHYEYAPFGAVAYTSKNTPYALDLIAANPFRFSSEFYDPELDLIYYNYRHYSPVLGRFLSRDPIEEQGGVNLYAFCGNNGIIKRDILGAASLKRRILDIDLLREYYSKINTNPEETMVPFHSQFFFDDGDNIGYFSDGRLREDSVAGKFEYETIVDDLDDCLLKKAIAASPPAPYSFLRIKISLKNVIERFAFQVNTVGQLVPVPVTRNITIVNIEIVDNCNSWAKKVLEKYKEMEGKCEK